MNKKKALNDKIRLLENMLREISDNQDFIDGIILLIDYEYEADEMIEFINKNKGLKPHQYTSAQMDMIYGKGNWEDGQLIEVVDD